MFGGAFSLFHTEYYGLFSIQTPALDYFTSFEFCYSGFICVLSLSLDIYTVSQIKSRNKVFLCLDFSILLYYLENVLGSNRR